ncbi:unnamed protein product [Adineta steineri]|uniref:ABC transporter domain-containing protein n=1 Tax=Adineta steineri TaxID=433720 RepID=A0A815LHV8_9BILA|nr:unnamed protein product [Adineta steineri]CAF4072000.1 unnamed protein product [Adineta steineri]
MINGWGSITNILVDGHDIRTLKLSWLRAQIGLIGQEPALMLDLTIGENISYGCQKQRIAIARALFRNRKVLLLDEATSALDVHNEKLVEESLNAVRQDNPSQTVIIVAHRLYIIQSCDLICVLGPHGRLLESGTHAELMAHGTAYRRFVLDHM